MFAPRFLALFALVQAAFALPHVPQLDSIPPNAANLALDDARGIFVAYDANGYILGELPASVGEAAIERRDAGSCVNVSGDDIQRLKGWDILRQYAEDNWGGKWDKVDANPEQYPDRGAQLCISGDVAEVTLDSDPRCSTQTQSSEGTVVGTEGKIALAATQGTTSSTTVTVTNQASLAVGASVSAKLSVPAISEVTASFTSTVTITNSLSSANTFTTSNAQTQTITIDSQEGKTCNLTFDVQTCDAVGHGSQRMVARGWVWIYYGKKKKGHYKWAINMDNVIPNEDDRATYIDFTTSTSSSTQSKYNAICQ